jgi:hypothetical protein
VFFRRPKAKISHEFIESYKRWKTKEITAVQAMKEAKVIKR